MSRVASPQPSGRAAKGRTTMSQQHDKVGMATHEEVCDQALAHYRKLAKECCHWNSVVEKAIIFYREHYARATKLTSIK